MTRTLRSDLEEPRRGLASHLTRDRTTVQVVVSCLLPGDRLSAASGQVVAACGLRGTTASLGAPCWMLDGHFGSPATTGDSSTIAVAARSRARVASRPTISDDDGTDTLTIVALVVGVLGLVAGAAGVVTARTAARR